jgi:hypothetical protein
MSNWVKTTPYGDYQDTPDRKFSNEKRNVHIIRKARALGICGKYAGSKPIDKLLQGIRTFEMANAKKKETPVEKE